MKKKRIYRLTIRIYQDNIQGTCKRLYIKQEDDGSVKINRNVSFPNTDDPHIAISGQNNMIYASCINMKAKDAYIQMLKIAEKAYKTRIAKTHTRVVKCKGLYSGATDRYKTLLQNAENDLVKFLALKKQFLNKYH